MWFSPLKSYRDPRPSLRWFYIYRIPFGFVRAPLSCSVFALLPVSPICFSLRPRSANLRLDIILKCSCHLTEGISWRQKRLRLLMNSKLPKPLNRTFFSAEFFMSINSSAIYSGKIKPIVRDLTKKKLPARSLPPLSESESLPEVSDILPCV